MAQVINTNIYSLNAQRNLNNTSTTLQTSLQRLSSGLRINSAKDDAAGLAIASRFTSQIRGYNQGVRNASDAISLAQTSEGAYDEISNNLQRIRELSVQSINATNSTTDRAALDTEVQQLIEEVNRASKTQFNGIEVIGSGATSFYFQVGPNAGSAANGITVLTTPFTGLSGYTAVNTGDVTTVSNAQTMLGSVDLLLASINTERATLGAAQNRFESVIRNGENIAEQLSASRSRIQDADFAKETANLTKAQILQQSGTAVLSQANAIPQNVLSLLQ